MTRLAKIICLLFPVMMLCAPAWGAQLPTAARVVLSKVHAHMDEGAHERALEVLENFQARGKKDPDPDSPDPRGYHHPEIYFAIGNIHLQKEAPQKAGKAYEQALERDPDHTYARLNLARVHYEQGNYARSAENFTKAYDTADPKEPEYLYYAAVTWLMDDAVSSSINAFEKLLDAHPDDIRLEWRENMVHALLSDDRGDEALVHIIILSAQYAGEKRIQWQEIRLYQYLRMDLKNKAYAYALELTRESPTTARWWKALAHVALARNNYESALVALTVYSYRSPLTTGEKKLLADLNLHVGIPVMAAPAYEAVMAEKPDKNMLHNLAIAYQQLEEPEKAIDAIASFTGHDKEPDLMILKADILYSMEKFADAFYAYEKAAKNNGRQAGRAWLMAGYAAWQMQDTAAARRAFKQAAEFDSRKKDAESALEQLRALD